MGEMAKERISNFNGLFPDALPEFIAFNAFAFCGIIDMASRERASAGLLRTK